MPRSTLASLDIQSNYLVRASFASAYCLWTLVLLLWGILLCALSAFGQNIQYSKNTADLKLRSNLTVNPSTRAVELQIPLGSYPGRAGANVPVTISYSSKVWRIDYQTYRPNIVDGHDIGGYTVTVAQYSEHASAGWTTSLDFPAFDTPTNETYDQHGYPITGDNCTSGCFAVDRMRIVMPDGSIHEFRSTDQPYDVAHPALPDDLYSVDGTRMRYQRSTSTLFMPDGSRYLFSSRQYIDRNGNTITYGNGSITDTLGRTIPHPFATADTYSLPGVGTSTINYTFHWKHLGDPGVLTTSQPLQYISDTGCGGLGSYSPHLFTSNYETIPTYICNASEQFNPVVLYQLDLPTGQHYTFTYNLFGEIDKVVLPTGGYERYEYTQITALTPMTYPYAYANRGVLNRYVSATGNPTDEVQWHYEGGGNYVLITAPDGSQYSRSMIAGTATQNAFGYSQNSALAGLPTGEAYYSAPDSSGTRSLLRQETTEWVATGSDATSLFSNAQQYADRNPRKTKEIEILYDSSGNGVAEITTYDYDTTYERTTGALQTAVHDYDYVSVDQNTNPIPLGTLLRTTETTYLDSNSAYRSRNILGLPTAVTIKNGAGIMVAQTTMSYDDTTLAACTGIINWTDPGSYRGNLTTTNHWLNTTNSYLATHVAYDQAGNAVSATDALNHTATTSYADSFADNNNSRNTYAYPTSVTTPAPDPSGTYGSTAGLTTATRYDYQTGLVTSATDANGQVTSFDYTDPLNRIKLVTRPDNGRTQYFYNDTVGNLYLRTLTDEDASRAVEAYQFFDGLGRYARAQLFVGSASYTTTDTQYDNLGRVFRISNPYLTALNTTPSPDTRNWTTTAYDALSRPLSVTTPDGAHVDTSFNGNTVIVTDQAGKKRRSVTDALGRLIRVDEPDGNNNFDDPVSGNPIQPTYYSYDPLGNLVKVAQDAPPDAQHPQGVQQRRYFVYDSLSRLLRAKNPEQAANSNLNLTSGQITALGPLPDNNNSWSMAYDYDANGNLTSKTDARGITASYSYDALNRNTTISYSNDLNNTPSISRYYDGAENGKGRFWKNETFTLIQEPPYCDPTGCTPTPPTKNLITSTFIDSYDVMGRARTERQRFYTSVLVDEESGTTTQEYLVQRTFDLAGHVKTQTYPSGHTVTYNYDIAGRLGDADANNLAFTGNLGDGVARTYARGLSYNERSQLQEEQYGTQTPLYHKLQYNVRGQLTDVRLSTQPDLGGNWNRGRLTFDYGTTNNNGNLVSQQNWIPNDDQISSYYFYQQNYAYDALNRLTGMQEYLSSATLSFEQWYSYDRWGNRTINGDATTNGINKTQFTVDAATNRLGVPSGQAGTIVYDPAGNLITNSYTPASSGASRFTYDAENRLTEADNGSQQMIARYSYDADGHRVWREVSGAEIWQVYGLDGELIAEYAANTAASAPQKEYGYRNGELLVTAEANAMVQWLIPDHLGTPRMIADKTGNLSGTNGIKRHDYLPFGEELFANIGGRTTTQGYSLNQAAEAVRQQFTGKERDNDVGLDYFGARYYSNMQGRFTSVDPANYQAMGDLGAPQSWNAYTYVNNNPCNLTDPDGRCICLGQRIKNFFKYLLPVTDEHLQRLEDENREYLREKQQQYGGTLIFIEDGQTVVVDPNTISREQVYHYAARLKEAEANGQIIIYTPEEVEVIKALQTTAMAAPVVNFGVKQLQKKFKHAGDFGITGNYNPSNAIKFQQAMENHLADPATKEIVGTYRGEPVIHYVNPDTGLEVITDRAGNFISSFKLNPAQLTNVLSRGSL